MQEEQNHFIKNIEIKNFKCFENFKAEGFGRVNLIGGKNNVGKTAFMESVCANLYAKDIESLYTTIMYSVFSRYKLEFINKNLNKNIDRELFEKISNINIESNINNISYKYNNKDGEIKYIFKINLTQKEINIKDFSYERKLNPNIIFLDSVGVTNKHLQKIYGQIQREDKEENLNSYIQTFEPAVEKFKILPGENSTTFEDYIPQCKPKGNSEYINLNEFGDGLKRFITLVCSIYSCDNSYLFIDEIENGIHYTNLDKLWEIILTISKEQNVQVFATTHSKECIESYARVAKRLEETDIKFLSLYRNREKELKSITLDYQTIQDRIELGLDNR
jgi:AAA15 family ATPase/GTPase